MDVVILGNVFGFPKGLAATRYVRLIAEGLRQIGSHVHVIVPNYTESRHSPMNTEKAGTFHGISYEYTTGTPVPPIGKLRLKFGRHRARYFTPLRLLQLCCQNRLDAVILYGRSHALLAQYSRWCNWLRIPLIVYVVEWSLAFPDRSMEALRNDEAFYGELCYRADAIVVISNFLQKKIAALSLSTGCSQVPILRTSLLCDPDEWTGVEPAVRSRPCVLYCAHLELFYRDTQFVIDAFKKIESSEIDLMLIGPTSEQTRRKILARLDRMGLRERTVLRTEYIEKEELFSLYAGASALLAPLSTDERSLARFPSKIADYLLSGCPVVSCAVGEVAEHLVDGDTAFLSAPDSVDAFAAKIEEALNSPKRVLVGLHGKQYAEETFNYVNQAQELEEFVRTRVKSCPKFG